jgi:hypothetical protein
MARSSRVRPSAESGDPIPAASVVHTTVGHDAQHLTRTGWVLEKM